MSIFKSTRESITGQFLASETILPPETFLAGPVLKTYHTSVTFAGKLFFWIFASFILFFIGLMIFLFYLERDIYIFAPLMSIFLICFTFFFLFLLVSIFLWVFRTHDALVTPIRRKIVVSLSTNGFLYEEGRKRQVITWEQIRWVQRLGKTSRKKPERNYSRFA